MRASELGASTLFRAVAVSDMESGAPLFAWAARLRVERRSADCVLLPVVRPAGDGLEVALQAKGFVHCRRVGPAVEASGSALLFRIRAPAGEGPSMATSAPRRLLSRLRGANRFGGCRIMGIVCGFDCPHSGLGGRP